MKKLILLFVSALVLCSSMRLLAADQPVARDRMPPSPQYEYAIVKWDGPDRLYFNLPDKFELKHLTKEGVTIPREAQAEEFCLVWAANKMAKDGWMPTSFDSRRILFRRAKAQ
jgi:hypothetical protein